MKNKIFLKLLAPLNAVRRCFRQMRSKLINCQNVKMGVLATPQKTKVFLIKSANSKHFFLPKKGTYLSFPLVTRTSLGIINYYHLDYTSIFALSNPHLSLIHFIFI